MKAIVYRKYGSPEVLELGDVDRPEPRDDEVLVRVAAASINSWDLDLLRGDFANRIIFRGFLKPKLQILGCDVAGRVESVGRAVTRFEPGDEVFGDLSASGWGCFAEHVCAREDALALKPANLTFEQAAAVPQAGDLALQGLYDIKPLQPGHRLLINGAGGGVGTLAVQIAKSVGAEVTGVDHTDKLDMLRGLGADHVVDYTQEDCTRGNRRYDLVLDVTARRSLFEWKRVLSTSGSYVVIGGSWSRILQTASVGAWISWFSKRTMALLMAKPNKRLEQMKELLEVGTVVPVIDRVFPLDRVPDAFRQFATGRVRGKLVIALESGAT